MSWGTALYKILHIAILGGIAVSEDNKKKEQLEKYSTDDKGKMTTNQGLKVSEDEFSLKAGERGPTLMEDFHFREKMTHFDHERIPERMVHARGFCGTWRI